MNFEPLVIIDRQQGWAHISIPKVACTSIRRALESHYKLEPAENIHGRAWPQSWTIEQLSFNGQLLNTWVVVRNPFDRLVSVWTEKCQPPAKPGLSGQFFPYVGQSFEAFCYGICEAITSDLPLDPHIAPMNRFTSYLGKPIQADYFDVDQLAVEWSRLQDHYGFPDLPRLNCTQHEPAYTYYDEDMIDLVRFAYREDFHRFSRLWGDE